MLRTDAVDHYSALQVFYRRLSKDASIHMPLWLDGTGSLIDANRNAQILMAQACSPRAGQRILDAGCGLGSTSVWLAREYGVEVVGVSNAAPNVAACRELAEASGTAALTSFQVADLMTDFAEPNSFDTVWNLESLNYLVPKRAFIERVFRILKPGGLWLSMDRYLDVDLASATGSSLRVLTEGFYTRHHWEAAPALQTKMIETGFTRVTFRDFTPSVLAAPRRRRVHVSSALRAAAGTLVNPPALRSMLRAMRVVRASYALMESGAMTYGLLIGKKGNG